MGLLLGKWVNIPVEVVQKRNRLSKDGEEVS